MNKNLLIVIAIIALVLMSLGVHAKMDPPEKVFGAIADSIGKTLEKIFSLSWMEDIGDAVMVMRMLLWVTLFTVYYWVLRTGLSQVNNLQIPRNAVLVIAFVLASISVLFMPYEAMVAVGIQWGEIGAAILMIPTFLIFFVAYRAMPATSAGRWGQIFILIVIIMYLYGIAMYFDAVEEFFTGGMPVSITQLPGTGYRYIFLPLLPMLMKRGEQK